MAKVVLLLGSLGALFHHTQAQRRLKTWRDTHQTNNRWETPTRNKNLPVEVDTESSNTDERFFSDFGWDDPNFGDLPDVLPGWGFSESQKVSKRQQGGAQTDENSSNRIQASNSRIRATQNLNSRTRGHSEDNIRTRGQHKDGSRTRIQLGDHARNRGQLSAHTRNRGQSEDNARTRIQVDDNIRTRSHQLEDSIRTREQLEDTIRTRSHQLEDNIRTRSQELLKENTRTRVDHLRTQDNGSGINENSKILDDNLGNTERQMENALLGRRKPAYDRRKTAGRQTKRRPDHLEGNVRRVRKKHKPREHVIKLNPEQASELIKKPRVITNVETSPDEEFIPYFSKKTTVAKTRTPTFSEVDGFLTQLSKSAGTDAAKQGTPSFPEEFLPREQTTVYDAKYADISQSPVVKVRKPSFTDDFLPALDLDIIKPVNSANNVPGYSEIVPFEIDTESSEVSEDDHPGSFSFGIFGENDQSTQKINKKKEEINSFFNDQKFFHSENIDNSPPKVTTYRPTFLFPGLDTTVAQPNQNLAPPKQKLALPKQNSNQKQASPKKKVAQHSQKNTPSQQTTEKESMWANKNIHWNEQSQNKEVPREKEVKDVNSGSREGTRNGFMPLETTMYTGLYDKLKEHSQANLPVNKKTYFKPTFFETPTFPIDDVVDTRLPRPIEKLSRDESDRRIRHFKKNEDKQIENRYFDNKETVTKPTTVSPFIPTVISFPSSTAQKQEIVKTFPTTERVTESGRTRQSYPSSTTKQRPTFDSKPKTRFVPTTLPPVATTPLTNTMNENKYAQTIVRNLKTRPVKSFTVVKHEEPVPEVKEQTDRIKNTNIQKENNYGATNVKALKTVPRKPSEMRLKDILKEIPQRRLNKILKSAGLKVTNLLRNEPEALEVVHNAMRGKESRHFEQRVKLNTKDVISEEKAKKSKDRTTAPPTKKKSGDWDSVKVPSAVEEDLDIDVEKMDVKTLMKTISPMSISEVLQKVGFSLKDIMRGNKDAIKAVLKYHRKQTKPRVVKEEPTYKSTTRNSETTNTFTKSTTTISSTTTTTTKKPTKPSGRKSIDLFKKFAKNFKYPGRTTRTTPKTTTTTETTSTHDIPSTTDNRHRLRFGQKTTTNRKFPSSSTFRIDTTNSDYDRMDAINTEYDGIDSVDTEEDISDTENNINDTSEEEETSTTMKILKEDLTTTQYSSVHITDTLKNLNMTVEDLEGKKNDQLETIMTLFGDFADGKGTPKNTEIIYGDKTEEVKKTPKKYKKYIATDIGGSGGVRGVGYNPFHSRGSQIITNRKTTTTTTTREPYTYLSYNDYNNEQSFDKQDDLELPNVIDYFYDDPYEDYNVYEVPTGVKSALIASSVVGGLAVSIFLFIFMLCLWKQMKNKLRMSTQYEECSKPGIFTNILSKTASKKSKTKTKNETTGYFNKVPATASGSQHWQKNNDSTSSEEY